MKKAMWWFAVLALPAAPATAQIKTSPLFIVERSKNANVVHYDARLTADGKLDPKEPVTAYWVLLAEDGRRPCRGGHRRPAGRLREDVHQRLRRAVGAQSPVYRGVW
jgi:hypothetical protein